MGFIDRLSGSEAAATTFRVSSIMVRTRMLPLVRTHERLLADELVRTLRHDLLNRLTGLGAVGFQLRQRLKRAQGGAGIDETTDELLAGLARQIGSVAEAVGQRVFDAPAVAPQRIDVPAAVGRLLGTLMSADAVVPEEPRAGDLYSDIDELELGVALACLIDNAAEASAEGPGGDDQQIEVTCHSAAAAQGGTAISVSDGGQGLDASATARAFERFFTTKPGHLGLGLNIATNVARRWSARIELAPRTDGHGGMCASLILPPVSS